LPQCHEDVDARNKSGHDERKRWILPMRRIFFHLMASALLVLPCIPAQAAEPAPREPYGIGLEGFAYPYPVGLLPLTNDGERVRMAYMDVAAAQPNGRVVVLLHGRNFPSSYWAPVIKTLNDAGYRVVVPDQIGFGKSSKPSTDLHFDTLVRNTVALLDHLQIGKADIVAHSLGGMLGVRIARLSGPGRASVAGGADRTGRLPALRAADSHRENSGERG
jgi:alpha/beta hydrolase fold